MSIQIYFIKSKINHILLFINSTPEVKQAINEFLNLFFECDRDYPLDYVKNITDRYNEIKEDSKFLVALKKVVEICRKTF